MSLAASIVVPLKHQRGDWLVQCVRSALDQTVPCETIVVIAPETSVANQQTLEVMARGNDTLKVLLESGRGFAAALNTGIRVAGTDRVGFLLSDDWLDPACVEECLPYQTDIVSTGWIAYEADGVTRIDCVTRTPTLESFFRRRTLERRASYLSHFFLFKKSALLAVGGVDEAIGCTGPDDYDLIWTLLERGATVSVVEKCLYRYRDHEGERLTLRGRDEQVQDLVKILDKHGVTGRQKEELISWHARSYGHPAYVTARERQGLGLTEP
ncbi:MAG: glycosyltransferase [Gemmatimonadota bacterium]|nr:MAG: glycosyltransferase [Gemmatimonadota bacterium]